MNLGVSADGVMAVCGIITIAGGVIAYLLQQKDKAQEVEMAAFKKAITLKDSEVERRIEELKANIDTAWRKVDILRDERNGLWTREEQARFEVKIETTTKDLRSEIRSDLETLGTRLSGDLANLGNRLDNSIRELMRAKQ